MSSGYVAGEAIVIAMICKNSEPKQRKWREVWVNPRLLRRLKLGVYKPLMRELHFDEEDYYRILG